MKDKPASLGWLRLDNAAKIYPAIRRAKIDATFRVSVTLSEEVDPAVLKKALERTLVRIPVFGMRLKQGVFWYYLEKNTKPILVEPDVANPCKPIHRSENNDYLFRVRYYHKRIALELFHVLADGTGAITFLKTLAAEYLRLQGIAIPSTHGILDPNDPHVREEREDAFLRYARKIRASRKEATAYHVKGTRVNAYTLNLITGIVPVDALLKKSREYKVSITEFLTAHYLLAFQKLQMAERHYKNRPIKVSVPINLRSYYPTVTLRNFSQYINTTLETAYGEFTFEEAVIQVHHFLRMRMNEKFVNAQICANVADEQNMIMRMAPLVFKNIALNFAYALYGESRFSGTLSNLGAIKLPEEMDRYVERFDFILAPGRVNPGICGAVSYGNFLCINFCRNIQENYIERQFFTGLVKMGIPVTIESNQPRDSGR